MIATQTIAAAIEKLETLRAKAEPGPWEHQPWGDQNQNGDYSGGSIFDNNGEYVLSDVSDAAGALVVTLHRAIDAILTILRDNAEGAHDFDAGATPDDPYALQTALLLARAILGET